MHAQSSAASIRLSGKPCFHRQPTNDDNGGKDGSEPVNKKPRSIKEEEDEETSTIPAPKQSRTERILRLFHTTLLQQFATVEAVYDSVSLAKATFEIRTDAGLESGSLGEGNVLVCDVVVEFEQMAEGVTSTDAKITVECEDEKLGANVRDCLRNVAEAAAPLRF